MTDTIIAQTASVVVAIDISKRGGSGKLNSKDKWIFRATAA